MNNLQYIALRRYVIFAPYVPRRNAVIHLANIVGFGSYDCHWCLTTEDCVYVNTAHGNNMCDMATAFLQSFQKRTLNNSYSCTLM
jgi:hypothetical protein